jgi:hypothetical protein
LLPFFTNIDRFIWYNIGEERGYPLSLINPNRTLIKNNQMNRKSSFKNTSMSLCQLPLPVDGNSIVVKDGHIVKANFSVTEPVSVPNWNPHGCQDGFNQLYSEGMLKNSGKPLTAEQIEIFEASHHCTYA